jgi:hypothetical protein
MEHSLEALGLNRRSPVAVDQEINEELDVID